MNSTGTPAIADMDPSTGRPENGTIEGFAGIAKLILAAVISAVAIIIQQIVVVIFSFAAALSQHTSSWEFKHGELILDGETRMSFFDLPTASVGMIWGSLAGISLVLLGVYFLGGRSLQAFNFSRSRWRSVVPWLIAFLVFGFVGHWVEQNYAQFQSKVMESMILAGRSKPFLLILGIGILAPIFEELIFRGILFKYIAKCWGGVVAVIATSIIFTLVHMQYNMYILMTVLVLALILGMMRLKSGSIWPGIYIHCFNNTMGVLAVLYFS